MVISIELQQEMFHQWFLPLIVSDICHVGPYCNSRHMLVWIMTWHILFIIGLLHSLLHPWLGYSKYCSFSRKSSFLLISASFLHHLSLGWVGITQDCHSTTNLILLGWPGPEPQLLHRALRAGVTATKALLCPPLSALFKHCLRLKLIKLNPRVLLLFIPIIPAQWKGKLPLTKSDLINNLQFFLTMLKKVHPQLKEKRIAVKFSDASSRGMLIQVLKFYFWPVLVCVWDFLDDRFVMF